MMTPGQVQDKGTNVTMITSQGGTNVTTITSQGGTNVMMIMSQEGTNVILNELIVIILKIPENLADRTGIKATEMMTSLMTEQIDFSPYT